MFETARPPEYSPRTRGAFSCPEWFGYDDRRLFAIPVAAIQTQANKIR
jgi:hypothetical protein